jgi:hypothetical protein
MPLLPWLLIVVGCSSERLCVEAAAHGPDLILDLGTGRRLSCNRQCEPVDLRIGDEIFIVAAPAGPTAILEATQPLRLSGPFSVLRPPPGLMSHGIDPRDGTFLAGELVQVTVNAAERYEGSARMSE